MGITYLVARVADTLADSGNLRPEERLEYLSWWRDFVHERSPNYGKRPPKIWKFNHSVGSFTSAEQELLLESSRILEIFHSFPQNFRIHGQAVLEDLCQGMIQAVNRFAQASDATPVFAHQTIQEFDHYCYQHAGCVGPFWSRVFQLNPSLELFSIDYGKALERINVLRDVVDDRAQGRILLPRSELQKFDLDSDRPWKESGWKDFVEEYVRATRPLLQHAANYCNAIPYKEWRLRYASSLPLRIGTASLQLFSAEQGKEKTTKISRKQIKYILFSAGMSTLFGRPVRV